MLRNDARKKRRARAKVASCTLQSSFLLNSLPHRHTHKLTALLARYIHDMYRDNTNTCIHIHYIQGPPRRTVTIYQLETTRLVGSGGRAPQHHKIECVLRLFLFHPLRALDESQTDDPLGALGKRGCPPHFCVQTTRPPQPSVTVSLCLGSQTLSFG